MKLAKPSSDNWNLKTSASLLVCKNAKRHLEQNENNTTILWLKCHIILNTQRSQLRQAHYNIPPWILSLWLLSKNSLLVLSRKLWWMNRHHKAANPRILFLSINYPTHTFKVCLLHYINLSCQNGRYYCKVHIYMSSDNHICSSINNPESFFS